MMKSKCVIYLLLLLAFCGCTTEGRRAEMRQRLQTLNELNRADSVLTAADRDEAQTLASFFDAHGTSNEQMLVDKHHGKKKAVTAAVTSIGSNCFYN